MSTLEDRAAITDLAVAYCWALDTHDWDRLDDVFLPDATASLGYELEGVEAIKARVRSALEPLDVSQHLVGTHQVSLEGDRATARCYLHAQHVRDTRQYIVAGRYDDEIVRTDAGWRIRRRVLTVLWTAGDSSALTG